MTTITTKLIKDGNSTAVRLPKTFLEMSGLSGAVQLNAQRGKITIVKAKTPRAGWDQKISQISKQIKAKTDQELSDWDSTSNDGTV
jgi:antitoxin MazE